MVKWFNSLFDKTPEAIQKKKEKKKEREAERHEYLKRHVARIEEEERRTTYVEIDINLF